MGIHDRLKVILNLKNTVIFNWCINLIHLGWIMILTTILMQMITLPRICNLFAFGVQVSFKNWSKLTWVEIYSTIMSRPVKLKLNSSLSYVIHTLWIGNDKNPIQFLNFESDGPKRNAAKLRLYWNSRYGPAIPLKIQELKRSRIIAYEFHRTRTSNLRSSHSWVPLEYEYPYLNTIYYN